MINLLQGDELVGGNVVGPDGGKIGSVARVYFDDETDAPEWAAVTTDLLGSERRLLPLADALWSGDSLTVPFDRNRVKDAPSVDPDREPSQADEAELYRYYGMEYVDADSSLPTSGTGSASGGVIGHERGSTRAPAGLADRPRIEGHEMKDALVFTPEVLRLAGKLLPRGSRSPWLGAGWASTSAARLRDQVLREVSQGRLK